MNNSILCPICKNNNVIKIYKNYPGYCEKECYDIYNCGKCNTNFILTDNIDDGIYETIYSHPDKLAFDRYVDYAQQIKDQKNPLKYLGEQEPCYFPVYKYLKNKKNLKILEIGCGYGYLTYAVKRAGFDVLGIDISTSVIDYALKNYGNYFKCSDLESFLNSNEEKYDLIITTEVIEHLDNQVDFILDCTSLLKPDGKVLMTTPNKNYFRPNAIWQTFLPPVHTVWLSKESFQFIFKKYGLENSFFNYSLRYPYYENKIVRYFKNQKENIPGSFILKNNKVNPEYEKTPSSAAHKIIAYFLHRFFPVRVVSNIIYNIFSGVECHLAVFFWKKSID